MKTLILGGSGFVGQALKRAIPSAMSPTRHECNLEDSASVSSYAVGVQGIEVLLQTVAVTRDEEDSETALGRNRKLMEGVSVLIKRLRPKLVVQISSVDVYGIDQDTEESVSESWIPNPGSYYARAKLEAERRLEDEMDGGNLVILRCASLFGPGDFKRKYNPSRFLESAKHNGKIVLFGDGKEKRDQLYVGDLVRAIQRILQNAPPSGVYNLVTHQPVSFLEVAQRVKELVPSARMEARERSREPIHFQFSNRKFVSFFPDFTFTPLPLALKDLREKLR